VVESVSCRHRAWFILRAWTTMEAWMCTRTSVSSIATCEAASPFLTLATKSPMAVASSLWFLKKLLMNAPKCKIVDSRP
jgi:hypothetical protein